MPYGSPSPENSLAASTPFCACAHFQHLDPAAALRFVWGKTPFIKVVRQTSLGQTAIHKHTLTAILRCLNCLERKITDCLIQILGCCSSVNRLPMSRGCDRTCPRQISFLTSSSNNSQVLSHASNNSDPVASQCAFLHEQSSGKLFW